MPGARTRGRARRQNLVCGCATVAQPRRAHQLAPRGPRERGVPDEDTADRVAAGMAGGTREAPGRGEEADTSARRTGRTTAPDALDGGGEGVSLRGAGRPGQSARSLRGP